MSIKYVLIGVVGLIAVGGGYWFMQTRASAISENTQQTSAEQAGEVGKVAEDGSFEGSIFALAQSGQSYKCTIKTTVQGVTVDGVVYVANKNIRGDFNSTVPMYGAVEGHMIADSSTVYVWSSVVPQGYKFVRTETGGSATVAGQTLDFNQAYSYKCVPAQADASLFVVPTNITFTAQS